MLKKISAKQLHLSFKVIHYLMKSVNSTNVQNAEFKEFTCTLESYISMKE